MKADPKKFVEEWSARKGRERGKAQAFCIGLAGRSSRREAPSWKKAQTIPKNGAPSGASSFFACASMVASPDAAAQMKSLRDDG